MNVCYTTYECAFKGLEGLVRCAIRRAYTDQMACRAKPPYRQRRSLGHLRRSLSARAAECQALGSALTHMKMGKPIPPTFCRRELKYGALAYFLPGGFE